jgi:hypothetical protein
MILVEEIMKLAGDVKDPAVYRKYLEQMSTQGLKDTLADLLLDEQRTRSTVPVRFYRSLVKEHRKVLA